jgi:acetyltransferase-like isoleucine patch superfamily enzyme
MNQKSDVKIGDGTIIKGNVAISNKAIIGNYCLIYGTDSQETIISENVIIQDFTTIFPGVIILEDAKIGSYVTLGHVSKLVLSGDDSYNSNRVKKFIVPEPKTIIGKGSIIRSYSTVYSNVITGRLITGHHTLIREHTTLGNNCLVGTGAVIDGYCITGNNSQIHQNCDIGQASTIGSGVFLGAHSILSDNKKMYRDVRYDLSGPTIGDYVRVGINSMILPDVTIGKHSLIGAASVVTKSIPECSLAYGSPARVIRNLTEEEIQEYKNSIK